MPRPEHERYWLPESLFKQTVHNSMFATDTLPDESKKEIKSHITLSWGLLTRVLILCPFQAVCWSVKG